MFSGVREIIRYNADQYLAGIAAVALLSLGGTAVIREVPHLAWAAWAGAAMAGWWIIASLLASWWIYDLSGLRKWEWLIDLAPRPTRWGVVHTGLDECGYKLRGSLAHAPGIILDTYDPAVMTEPSIRRARVATATERRADARCRWDALPCASATLSNVYLIMSAHELRRPAERSALFHEAARCLESGGRLVLVEHARDISNFIAFGPGFLHFWPARVWDETAYAAGLACCYRGRKAGFIEVRVYQKGKPDCS